MTTRGLVISTRFHRQLVNALRREWRLIANLGTTSWFAFVGQAWLTDLSHPVWFGFILAWLFIAILLSAFAVVKHAEIVAVLLGEPLGTVVLTLCVTGIEVMLISAVMLTGEGNAELARDAMFAVVMIVLNGMVGLSLLLGALRYREQTYNLQGANAFLAVIVPLAVLDLVLPNVTTSSGGATLSRLQSIFLIVMSIGLYCVFLAIQNVRHRDYFMSPPLGKDLAEADHISNRETFEVPSVGYHIGLLCAYLSPLIFLCKKIAIPIDYAAHAFHVPPAVGGLLVAVMILSPESVAAVRAALANGLQRSVNILFGSVLATISLTIPAVLTVGLLREQTVVLGLSPVDTTLLLLTLGVSLLTFGSARTNIFGAVHLLLFLAYLMLILETIEKPDGNLDF